MKKKIMGRHPAGFVRKKVSRGKTYYSFDRSVRRGGKTTHVQLAPLGQSKTVYEARRYFAKLVRHLQKTVQHEKPPVALAKARQNLAKIKRVERSLLRHQRNILAENAELVVNMIEGFLRHEAGHSSGETKKLLLNRCKAPDCRPTLAQVQLETELHLTEPKPCPTP